jgi:adenylate cyclase
LFDRELHDVFAVQDEVVRAIVATLAAHVKRAEIDRALLKPPTAWESYEYYLRGAEALLLHMNRRTKASLNDARRMLEQSLAIDPDYARAAAMLSQTYSHAYVEPFDGDYLSPAALDRALELAETAAHLDPRLPQAHAQLGYTLPDVCTRQVGRMSPLGKGAAPSDLSPTRAPYRSPHPRCILGLLPSRHAPRQAQAAKS